MSGLLGPAWVYVQSAVLSIPLIHDVLRCFLTRPGLVDSLFFLRKLFESYPLFPVGRGRANQVLARTVAYKVWRE